MVNMSLNNKLDILIKDIESTDEKILSVKLANYLSTKYGDIFSIDEHKKDPYVAEYIDVLNELSNLSIIISNTFKNELEL